jgi:hypothetical protein
MLPAARIGAAPTPNVRVSTLRRAMRAWRPVHASAGRKVPRSIQRGSDGGLRSTPHWHALVRGVRLDPYRMRETLARPGDVQ